MPVCVMFELLSKAFSMLLLLLVHRFWMGVELDTPTGKNNGSMNGVRYFRCRAQHGVFVLQSKVKRTSEPHHQLATTRRIASSGTPVSSGADSTDYASGSGSVSLATSGASGASEAETTSPSPHASPASTRKRLGASSNSK